MKSKALQACFFTIFAILAGNQALSADSWKNPSISKIHFDFTVSQDNSGTHKTVQEAVNAAPDNSAKRVFILIKAGTYKEVITIPAAKPNICLIGEDAAKTVLTFDNYSSRKRPDGSDFGTTGSASVIVNAADFYAEYLTIENSTDEATAPGDNKQAVALYCAGDRAIFKSCRFTGNQDTLFTRRGRQYYRDCYIEGDVDFIFGDGPAWFENCELFSLNRIGSTKGYLTASSTPASQAWGYVFYKCRLTAEEGVGKNSVFLGRGWHPSSYSVPVKSCTLFIYCNLGEHIFVPAWSVMDSSYPLKTERLREYKNEGPGAGKTYSTRFQLTDEEAKLVTLPNVLGGTDNWDPVIP